MLQKIKAMMGFASKSGKISYGHEQVIRAVRSGKGRLVIVAEDVSEASLKKLTDKCNFYDVEMIKLLQRDELSKCIGKDERTCVAINDKGFADTILKYYEAMQRRSKGAV